jgi:serine protease
LQQWVKGSQMAELDRLLDYIRTQQSLNVPRELRIVLESKQPSAVEAVQADVEAAYRLTVSVTPLFGGFGEEGTGDPRFLLLRIPGVSIGELPESPFVLAHDLVDRLHLVSAEPDLSTDFYMEEPKDLVQPGAESVSDVAFWCWAPDQDDPHDYFWALDKVNARQAWKRSESGSAACGEGVLVFQPDTGIADHVELQCGMLDLSRSWDFVLGCAGATDPLLDEINPGHGTGTSSVVASRAEGKMTGSAPATTLVPLRCVTTVAVFNQSPVAAAVDYARRKGAHVITMSLGGVWSSALHAAVHRAVMENVIVLAAAGNCVETVVWPARFAEVIAVAGVNKDDKPWRGSCRGPEVTISAPAEFVPRAKRNASTDPQDVVDGGQGTSFAVALTAGIAAIWLAHYGRDHLISLLKPGESLSARFRLLLAATARVPEGLDTANFGAGIVDADRLLERDPEALSAPAAGSELVGDRFISIKSLVSETTSGLESAPTTIGAFDWNRHALEASYLSLRVARTRKAQSSLATESSRVEAASRAPRFGSSAQFRQDAAESGDPRLIALSQVR